MIWFFSYRFDYPVGVSDVERQLSDAFEKHELKHSIEESEVKVEKPLGLLFHNSWNPIFIGRLQTEGKRCYLRGYFRVHWYTMVFSVFFLGMILYQLWEAFQLPESVPGKIPGWRAQEIESMLTFIALFFGVTFIGWVFGLPNANRILTALRESTAARQGVVAEHHRTALSPRRNTGFTKTLNRWGFYAGCVAFFLAVSAIVLMLVGNFVKEETCFCSVPGHWECKGESCSSQMSAHVTEFGHTVTCNRTDWPTRTLVSIFSVVFPQLENK